VVSFQARHRIFGTHIGNGERSGRKVLRKALAAEKMADWYMPRLTHIDPVFADPKEDLCVTPSLPLIFPCLFFPRLPDRHVTNVV
jgi:hypothetical protein